MRDPNGLLVQVFGTDHLPSRTLHRRAQMANWQFDPFHTQVEFSAKHLGMMTVRGHFADVVATGEIHPDKPESTKIEATIKTESIRTHNEQRAKDLRSSNFLEIDKVPN